MLPSQKHPDALQEGQDKTIMKGSTHNVKEENTSWENDSTLSQAAMGTTIARLPRQDFDCIYNPPVNSSGDVYHIAAYLLICKFKSEVPPLVVLFYDTDDTRKQALRSQTMLRTLGFTANVKVKEIIKRGGYSYHANARNLQCRKAVCEFSVKAIDQKASTSLICNAVNVYGARLHLEIRRRIGSPEHLGLRSSSRNKQVLNAWVEEKCNHIFKSLQLRKHHFVVLNLRASTGTNNGQNLSLPQLKTIAKAVDELGMKLVILDVGGEQGSEFSSKATIKAFAEVDRLDGDFAKYPHMSLLIRFAEHPNFKGVIGNTSGTLDIAAFMGIRTLCIHRFKKDGLKNCIVPAQDLRVLLMAPIMSIFDNNLGLVELCRTIQFFIRADTHIVQTKRFEKVTLEEDRFRLDHVERSCFALDVNKSLVNPKFPRQLGQVQRSQLMSTPLSRIAVKSPSSSEVKRMSRFAKDDIEVKKEAEYAAAPRGRRLSFT